MAKQKQMQMTENAQALTAAWMAVSPTATKAFAEKIAARWADHRGVAQIGFAPDWTKHGRAAPFKRNDQMLEIVPKGVMHFPGTGIDDNLADKAKKLGIPVWKFGGA